MVYASDEGIRREEYARDGSVDLTGNPVIRSKTGRWTACSFIIGYEIFERMAYNGIASNLVVFLTTKLHQGTVASSTKVTNWAAVAWLMPVVGAYVGDSVMGRYWTIVVASSIYLTGMVMLTLVVSVADCKDPNPDHCRKRTSIQTVIFYTALYILALGTGGTKPNISTMGADQFDESDPAERKQKLSFFNWWMFSVFIGALISSTILVYVQDNVGWSLGYGLPTMGLLASLLLFLAGTPHYRHKLPTGSPFTQIARVLVAAVRKWQVPLPDDPKELHENHVEVSGEEDVLRIESTPSLRFLDRAAVKIFPSTPWLLCTVTEVEETKQMTRMIPILIATIVPSCMLSQVNTLFVKQATTMERHLGANFFMPPASLIAFTTLSMLIFVVLYDKILVKIIKKYTQNPRGITLLQRMGVGLIVHIMIMAVASITEKNRLQAAVRYGVRDSRKGTIPLSVLTLLPQFILMGIADGLLEVAKMEFYYDQAANSMKSLGTSYYTSSMALGNCLNSFMLTTVSRVTAKGGGKGWILDNLNESHLDYYYEFFTVLNLLNFLFSLMVSKSYVYKRERYESEETEMVQQDCQY